MPVALLGAGCALCRAADVKLTPSSDDDCACFINYCTLYLQRQHNGHCSSDICELVCLLRGLFKQMLWISCGGVACLFCPNTIQLASNQHRKPCDTIESMFTHNSISSNARLEGFTNNDFMSKAISEMWHHTNEQGTTGTCDLWLSAKVLWQ